VQGQTVSTYKHDDISPNSVSITNIVAIKGNRPKVMYTLYLKLTILEGHCQRIFKLCSLEEHSKFP